MCCICCCVSQYYNYQPTAQINPFRPSTSHSATDRQSCRFSVKIFSLFAIAGVGEERGQFFFFTGARTRSRRPLLPFQLIRLENGPLSYVYAPETCVTLSSNPYLRHAPRQFSCKNVNKNKILYVINLFYPYVHFNSH